MARRATYQWQMSASALGYVTGTYQHVGSRFTQVATRTRARPSACSRSAPNTIGDPLTQATFNFDPELPAYDLVNLRLGVLKGNWDVALFGNNLTDERAFLALDRERGLRARVGYLTNQPRTFGLTARFAF